MYLLICICNHTPFTFTSFTSTWPLCDKRQAESFVGSFNDLIACKAQQPKEEEIVLSCFHVVVKQFCTELNIHLS